MAFDAFLYIDSIEGESKDDRHKGWIEVLKYGLGKRQCIVRAPSSCGGVCAGRADFLNLAIKKRRSTPPHPFYRWLAPRAGILTKWN